MNDPRVVDMFFDVHGTEDMAGTVPRAPAPAARHSALQAPLRTGEDQRDLDLQTFFDLGHALAVRTSMSELGEAVWLHLQDPAARLDVRALCVRSNR